MNRVEGRSRSHNAAQNAIQNAVRNAAGKIADFIKKNTACVLRLSRRL